MVADRDSEGLRKSALEHLWMNSADWVEMAESEGPVITMTGKGVKTVDSSGKTWIDVNGGYASVNIGYGRTEIADAVREQMNKITFFPQGTTTEPLVKLAAKLAELTPGSMDRVWPVTGGSEANEIAVKIARAYHKRNGEPQRYKIISCRNSGHGATGGVMWQGGNATYPRWEYEPAYPGMIYAPHPDYNRCELGSQTPSECAILCAQAVEDLIQFHGPKTVAAFVGEHRGARPGRHGARRRVLAHDPRDMRQVRRSAHRRRGGDRLRPYRQVVREQSLGPGARHHGHGQGDSEQLPALRGDDG